MVNYPEEKPNLKQWLPIYGIYQLKKDLYNHKPLIFDENRSIASFFGGLIYHTGFVYATIICLDRGLQNLVDRLF